MMVNNKANETPQYDELLVPQMVDAKARDGHRRPYALVAKTQVPADGFQEISYARFANAINRAAWYFDSILKDSERSVPFAYLGATTNDLRYMAFSIASAKSKRKVLFPSIRNPVGAQVSLFEKLGCKTVLYASSLTAFLQPLFVALDGIRIIAVPEFDEIFDVKPVTPYEYNETLKTAGNDTLTIFHTSGSSGDPRPIEWTNAMGKTMSHGLELGSDEQGPPLIQVALSKQNALNLFPLFHAGGWGIALEPIFYDSTLVLGYQDMPPTVEYISQILEQNFVTSVLSPPSILEDFSKNARGLELLAQVDHVGYGGGPLHPDAGAILAKRLKHLFSYIGATEIGWHRVMMGTSEQWDCLRFHPQGGYYFEEVFDGMYEMVIRNDDISRRQRSTFFRWPHLKEYRTKDLYEKVAGKPGWLRYRGRTDDLIVMSNGEKIDPIPLESVIRKHPLVQAALIIGEQRKLPALLIELKDGHWPADDNEREKLRDQIFPVVKEANKIAPNYSQISKSMILFAARDKPFKRAGKGTVQRQLTVQDYSEALKTLYEHAASERDRDFKQKRFTLLRMPGRRSQL